MLRVSQGFPPHHNPANPDNPGLSVSSLHGTVIQLLIDSGSQQSSAAINDGMYLGNVPCNRPVCALFVLSPLLIDTNQSLACLV